MWVCHGNAIKPAGDSQVPEELWPGQHPPPQPSSSTPSPPHPFPLIPHSSICFRISAFKTRMKTPTIQSSGKHFRRN